MKEGWDLKTLGDIGKPSMCKRVFKNQTLPDGDIPFYKIGTFGKKPDAFIAEELYKEYRDKFSFPKKGDVLISASGTIGRRVRYNGEPAYFQDSNIVWIDHDESMVTNDYLYHFYGFCDWKASKGATISRLYNGILKQIEIPIPPLPEQERIVAKLDTAFAVINQAKANVAQNLQNAKELFQSKLNEVFSQRPLSAVEGKGDGWVEKKLGELGTLTSSRRIFKSEYVAEGVPFYRSKEIKELGNGREVSLELFITKERYQEIKKTNGVPQKGDILLTAVGTIGEMYVVQENETFYFKDGNIMWLKDFDTLDTYFLKYALTSFVEQLKALSHGSAYSALTIQRLKEYSIQVPQIEVQKQIVNQLDLFKETTEQLQTHYTQKLTELEDLKKSLLERAFKGEN